MNPIQAKEATPLPATSEQDLFSHLARLVTDWRKSLEDVGFADYDTEQVPSTIETLEDLLRALETICSSSKELNYLLNEAPNSFFVCDANATAIRVNKTYETMVNMSHHEVYGKSMREMHENGTFRPSVCWLALRERRPVTVMQEIRDVKNMVVTGVPVFDEHGELIRACTNAIKIDDMKPLQEHFLTNEKSLREPREASFIIAASPAMNELMDLVRRVKDSDSCLLISGETGVGKSVLAAYIHETGPRQTGRFIHINCGAIPENLLESELFGYEGGAFTGADKKGKPGLIELADGGTLFLDEINELPLLLQVKLLHFLQTKHLTRVGGTQELQIDTRVIAASNVPLEDKVSDGSFRSDLYYRINVIPLHIPPLRERPEDVLTLADYFLAKFTKKYNKRLPLGDKTREEILAREWRGNIRELENYIERLVVTSDAAWFLPESQQGDESGRDSVMEKTFGTTGGTFLGNADADVNTDTGASGLTSGTPAGQGGARRLDKAHEKELILEAYRRYGSSYKVAQALGLSQSTAYRKIKKYTSKT